MTCGGPADCCPICGGAGEVMVPDQQALERGRRGRPEDDPPEAFDVPVTCQHCGGSGRHVCLEPPCDACGAPATHYVPAERLVLCSECYETGDACPGGSDGY